MTTTPPVPPSVPPSGLPNPADRIAGVLNLIHQTGQPDGAHHLRWIIDQLVRHLTGCPTVTRTARDYKGAPHTYPGLGESPEYREFVAAITAGEDGPDTYEWDEGIAP